MRKEIQATWRLESSREEIRKAVLALLERRWGAARPGPAERR